MDRTAFEATDVDLGLAGGVAIGASQRQQRPSGGETAADRRLNIRARDEEAFQAASRCRRISCSRRSRRWWPRWRARSSTAAAATRGCCRPSRRFGARRPHDGAAAGRHAGARRGIAAAARRGAGLADERQCAVCGARAADGARALPRRLRAGAAARARRRPHRVEPQRPRATHGSTHHHRRDVSGAGAGGRRRRWQQQRRAAAAEAAAPRRAPLRPGARRVPAIAAGQRPAGSAQAAPDGGSAPRAARPRAAAAAAAARDGAPSRARPHAAGWARRRGRRRAGAAERRRGAGDVGGGRGRPLAPGGGGARHCGEAMLPTGRRRRRG